MHHCSSKGSFQSTGHWRFKECLRWIPPVTSSQWTWQQQPRQQKKCPALPQTLVHRLPPQVHSLSEQPHVHCTGSDDSRPGHVGPDYQRVVCPGADRQHRDRPHASARHARLPADSAVPIGLHWHLEGEQLLAEAFLLRGASAHHGTGAGGHRALQSAGPDRNVPPVGNARRCGALPGRPGPEVHHGWDSDKPAVLWCRQLPRLGGQHVSSGWLT